MSATPSKEVSHLLAAWSDGERSALDKLLPLVERELRRLAHRYTNHEGEDHTLQTTALVNEAYRVVELRYFGGLSVEETATALGVSANTITRDWRRPKAFPRRELSQTT